MLEGYKPIDFSSIFPPMDLGQMRNRAGLSQAALGILANSKWNKTPITTLLDSGLTVNGEVPKRQQTLWGRAVDLLSTPAYAVANAADDALAGHQSNDTDSVLSDAGQILGGIVTGAGRGIGTGLRGAFAGSETAADPMDKQYLGDFLIRLDTHMSAEDAMKPENLEEVRSRLKNKKINLLSNADEDKYFYNFDTKNVEVTNKNIEQYFKDMQLYGLAASAVGDPLNLIKGPTGVLSAAKGKAEVPGAITGSKNTFDGFKSGPLNIGVNAGDVKFKPTITSPAGSYKVTLPPGAIQNKVASPSTGELITAPSWFRFPDNPAAKSIASTPARTTATAAKSASPVDKINVSDPLDEILNSWTPGQALKTNFPFSRDSMYHISRPPDAQLKVVRKLERPGATTKLIGDLLRRIVDGEVNWSENLVNRLRTKYPSLKFPETNELIKFISTIDDMPKRLGDVDQRKAAIVAFTNTLHADIQAMKTPAKVLKAEVIINNAAKTNPVDLARLVAGAKPNQVASKNPTRDTQIVTDLVSQFGPQLALKTIPPGIHDVANYKKAMLSHGAYTGPKQVNVWNTLTSKHLVNVKTPNRFKKALDILRQTEDIFIRRGHVPMSSAPKLGGSVPLRLSQVLDAIGPAAAAMDRTLLTKILRGEPEAISHLDAPVIQKIEELKAGEAIVDGSKAIQGVDTASKRIEDLLKGTLSVARSEQIVTVGAKVASDITKFSGGSAVAANTAKKLVEATFSPKSPVNNAIKKSGLNTTALISHPNVSPQLLAKYSSAPGITRAINLTLGGPSLSKLGKLMNSAGAMIPEWLGARFNAAYKNADMHPIYLKNVATAKSTVARRADFLNKLARTYDVNDADLWNDALKGAQGRMAPLEGGMSSKLAKEIQKIMEDLFGSSGLRSSVVMENSVAGRSQLFMSELNSNLRRFGLGQYQFFKKSKKTKEYEEGVKWLNSWESWEIEKPLDFLFKIQNVVEHTVREKTMIDEIAGRFGTRVKGGDFTHTIKHPRLAGYYFGEEAASQINQFLKVLKELKQPSSKAMQHFDKALSKWKAAVTIYVPSHHIRNVIGDVYFNWLGGVNSSRPYGTALRVMQSQKNRYEGIEELHNLTSPSALKNAIAGKTPSAVGKQTALTMKDGTHVSNDMVYISAFQQGILPTTRVLEDIPDDAMSSFEKFRPLGGKGQKFAHTISEGRDHYVRLAHYIDALKKSNKGFEAATEEAAAIVRKWHPDGMDMTKFEKHAMRRMFPFYSWTRKALPLMIESIVATPGKVMVIPKANYLLQNMLGIQTGPMSDPFPYDQLFPDWIREKGIGPVAGPDSGLTSFLGGAPGYSVVNPGNPTMDLISQLNNPGKMTMGMLNPAARIPIELSTGRDSQSGAPIDGVTDVDYIAKQLPGVSHVGRATGEFGVSDSIKAGSSGYNMQNIINLLFGAGVQNTGPYKKSAEFDLRDYIKSLRS
jgi:hypothetical protein